MKLVIMQPYFMPYIGYWQLLNAADKFVIYDDVNYIKQGWVNRNRVLVNDSPSFITIPLNDASSFKRINSLEIQSSNWRNKLLKTIVNTYTKSKYFSDVFPAVEKIVMYSNSNLSEYVGNSIREIASLLSINTEIVPSSSVYNNDFLMAQDRVLDICKRESATVYINAPGGRELYSFSDFSARDINLKFISPTVVSYKQGNKEFVPYLSIIDQLMRTGIDGVQACLDMYSLESCNG